MNLPVRSEEFCGKVPLHQTNLIQPHGVLLIIEKGTRQILQASENVNLVFGKEAADVVGQPLDHFLRNANDARFKELFEEAPAMRVPFLFESGAGKYLGTLKAQEEYYILELEVEGRSIEGEESFVDVYHDVKITMASLNDATDMIEVCNKAIAQLKRVSGFDKIMIYKFDEDWNGDVIAEGAEEGMESYLGLKFPASDIPKQARALYQKVPYRLIPNVSYTPVRIYPLLNPVTNSFTDLSDSNLRSVAGVHLEYLRNMKVQASMSTRILVDGKLWGLIACHHRTPKYLSYEVCSLFELLSDVISSKISAMRHRDLFEYKIRMKETMFGLLERLSAGEDLVASASAEAPALLALLSADGVAFSLNGVINTWGKTPSPELIEELVLWLQSKGINKLYHDSSLSAHFEGAEAFSEEASGIVALPIQADQGDYIIAFRGEAARQIQWGGNPDEAITFEPGTTKYHPRASFRIWQESVRRSSIPWSPDALDVAESFRQSILEYSLNKMYQ